jgi:hypothetical protein
MDQQLCDNLLINSQLADAKRKIILSLYVRWTKNQLKLLCMLGSKMITRDQ